MQLNTKQESKIDNLSRVLESERSVNDNLRKQLKLKDDIINGSDDLNGTGELSMKALKYQLAKERVKNKWLSIGGTSMTVAAVVLVINLLNSQ